MRDVERLQDGMQPLLDFALFLVVFFLFLLLFLVEFPLLRSIFWGSAVFLICCLTSIFSSFFPSNLRFSYKIAAKTLAGDTNRHFSTCHRE